MSSFLMRIFFIFALILFTNRSYSQLQNQKECFRIYLHQTNLMYTSPAVFQEADTCSEYLFYYTIPKLKDKYLYPLNAKLLSKDSSLCIGFNIVKVNLKDDSSAFLKVMFPGRTANTNYKLGIRHKADTIHDRVVYYSSKESKRHFNADISGTYGFEMQLPFDGRYYRCRIVFMHKDNVGDAEIYYFYENERQRKEVDRLIKNAYKLLRYKD